MTSADGTTQPPDNQADSLDVLFVSEKPLWPMDQGYRIRASNLSHALARLGVRVGVACMSDDSSSPTALVLQQMMIPWPEAEEADREGFTRAWAGMAGWLRRKVASHQGIDIARSAGVRTLVKQHKPAVVVAMGQHGPMFLRGLRDMPVRKVWYAADELMRFHASCMMRESPRLWKWRLRQMAAHAALETSFVRGLDAAIGVSPLDAMLLRHLAGAKDVALIRNGVDLDYYHPRLGPGPRDPSLVFWGRLDFEPNIDAVCWFAREIWPALQSRQPDARWTIVGKFPHAKLDAVAKLHGVTLLENVPDIRPHAHGASVTLLPMRCGGGIKNKLLEAAAMGLPIVASGLAIQGLDLPADGWPVRVCHRRQEWVDQIIRLWGEAQTREIMGAEARRWVEEHHSWDAAAVAFARWMRLASVVGESGSSDGGIKEAA